MTEYGNLALQIEPGRLRLLQDLGGLNSGLRLNNRPADLGPLAGSIILHRRNLSNTSQNLRPAYTGYQTLALTVQLIATEGASKT